MPETEFTETEISYLEQMDFIKQRLNIHNAKLVDSKPVDAAHYISDLEMTLLDLLNQAEKDPENLQPYVYNSVYASLNELTIKRYEGITKLEKKLSKKEAAHE